LGSPVRLSIVPRQLPKSPALLRQQLPALPQPRLPSGTGPLALGMARVASGRVDERGLLRALGCRSGHRVHVSVVDRAILVAAHPTGLSVVGGRGEVAL